MLSETGGGGAAVFGASHRDGEDAAGVGSGLAVHLDGGFAQLAAGPGAHGHGVGGVVEFAGSTFDSQVQGFQGVTVGGCGKGEFQGGRGPVGVVAVDVDGHAGENQGVTAHQADLWLLGEVLTGVHSAGGDEAAGIVESEADNDVLQGFHGGDGLGAGGGIGQVLHANNGVVSGFDVVGAAHDEACVHVAGNVVSHRGSVGAAGEGCRFGGGGGVGLRCSDAREACSEGDGGSARKQFLEEILT